MAAARTGRVRVELVSETADLVLSAAGSETAFDGFLRVYREGWKEEDGTDGLQCGCRR